MPGDDEKADVAAGFVNLLGHGRFLTSAPVQ